MFWGDVGFARGGGIGGRSAIIGVIGGAIRGMGMIGGTIGGMDSMRGVGGTTRTAAIVKLGEGGHLTKCEGLSVKA